MHHIMLEGISITPAPSLPWQPLLPGNLRSQHPSVGWTLQLPNPPENFGSMTEINTKKIWWIGETPWKRKHWKHQELVFHSTRPTPIGDVSGQISSTTFNPFDHFDAPVYHYPSRNHWIIESFPSVGRCHFPLWNILSTALEKIVNNRDIVRSL